MKSDELIAFSFQVHDQERLEADDRKGRRLLNFGKDNKVKINKHAHFSISEGGRKGVGKGGGGRINMFSLMSTTRKKKTFVDVYTFNVGSIV